MIIKKNSNKNEVDCIGIIVIYYESFMTRAVIEFEKLIHNISENSKVVIVSNSISDVESYDEDSILLRWDNTYQEFGAWQFGINEVLKTLDDNSKPCFIFANDTFCHHRKFGTFEKSLFIRSFKKIINNKKKIITGPTSTSKLGKLGFDGCTFDRWVSTYLFGISFPFIKKLKFNICLEQIIIDRYFGNGNSEDDFFSKKLNENLKKHLVAWLFGRKGFSNWRAGESLNKENYIKMKNKASSIFREKYLTAFSINNKIKIVDVFYMAHVKRKLYFLFNLSK